MTNETKIETKIDKRKVRYQKDLCNNENGNCINYAGTYYYMEDGEIYWELSKILNERMKKLHERIELKRRIRKEKSQMTNKQELKHHRWFCEDCKGKMYIVKYKKIGGFLGMDMKKSICYYCKSEKLKYIGQTKEEFKEVSK